MAIKDRRVQKKGEVERTYRGEAEAIFLVNELNKGHMTRRGTLNGIIQALQELGEYQSGLPGEQRLKISTINKVLRQYQARPLLRGDRRRKGGFRLEWQRPDDDLELQAVLRAVELAQEGLIASVKECPNPECKRWLFARFPHQKYCSEACKDVFHKVDPAEKERRRKWAKENYKSRKELDLGSRETGQAKKGKK